MTLVVYDRFDDSMFSDRFDDRVDDSMVYDSFAYDSVAYAWFAMRRVQDMLRDNRLMRVWSMLVLLTIVVLLHGFHDTCCGDVT